MSINSMNMNINKSYLKNNRIRSKLLLIIDNEIQSKIKQKNLNIKFNYDEETPIKICFEETFIQEQVNKYDFSYSNISKNKKNDNLDKSFPTTDDSLNKVNQNSRQKGGEIIHSKTFFKQNNHPNKILNNSIYFNKKIYSIKHLSRQSSTFLILPKQKNAIEYLKTLCNNLKICKKEKKILKHFKSIDINTKFLGLNDDKKITEKLDVVKTQKSKKDNIFTFSLFRKSNKRNLLNNSKRRTNKKNANSILITSKQGV